MKKILILVLALVMCLTLVGCGDTEEVDNNIEKTTERSEPVGE
jgi:uncharacterized lipoprotein YehR (DUF1307 family)